MTDASGTLPVLNNGNKRSMGREVWRLLQLDAASKALGGAAKLADVIGVSRRMVNYKLNAERSLTDFEMRLAADAIEARARELDALAADIRGDIA